MKLKRITIKELKQFFDERPTIFPKDFHKCFFVSRFFNQKGTMTTDYFLSDYQINCMRKKYSMPKLKLNETTYEWFVFKKED